MEPLSYTNAPIGLNFLIVGATHQWGSVLVDPTLPVKDVTASVDTATLAYMRVFDFWGQSGSLAMVVPNAWLSRQLIFLPLLAYGYRMNKQVYAYLYLHPYRRCSYSKSSPNELL